MKRRIAFVRQWYLPPSETFIYEELKNIKRHKPIVFGRRMMNLNLFPYPRIQKLPRKEEKIIELMKKNNIELIHARFGSAGMKLVEVKKALDIPMITSFHGHDVPARQNEKYLQKLRPLFQFGELFTVPCLYMKKLLVDADCPESKVHVMYSGIDMGKFAFRERDKKTKGIRVVAVGRLHKKKGFDYLIRAFQGVKEKHPSSELVIVGWGDERDALEALIEQSGLKGSVQLKGIQKHDAVAKELQKADIFCLPSITTEDGNHEGIPNAIKEAMATGLPVVSTSHAGIPELVADGEEGFLVPERSVARLAEKIGLLIEEPKLRRTMGAKGHEKVKTEFNSANQVKKLESLYESLL